MSLNFTDWRFVDVHYHATPDLYQRRYHAIEAGKHYKALKGAVVLKSHLGSTAVQASILQHEGLPVFPSLVLNSIAGGIHYRTIIKTLAEYTPVIPSKLIVHFPTITGRAHNSKLARKLLHPELSEITSESETIFNRSDKLRREIIDILKLTKDYPIVLSSGHASKNEIYSLIEACEKIGVSALLLNQPANPLTGLNACELKKITQCSFVWVEQTALTYLLGYQDPQDFKEVLCNLPNVIYSSDLGQTSQMDIAEWLSCSEKWFTQFKISSQRRKEICLTNPLRFLGI